MLSYFGPRAGADEVAMALNAQGAAIVKNVISRDTAEQIRGELEPWLPSAYLGQDAFAGLKTRRLGGLTVKSPTFANLLTKPLMLGVYDRLLQPHCSLYQLALTQAIEIGAGEPAQTLHRDDICYSINHIRSSRCSSHWPSRSSPKKAGRRASRLGVIGGDQTESPIPRRPFLR